MVFHVNVPVGDPKPGETAPYRMYRVKDGAVMRPVNWKCTTVYEYFKEALKMNGLDAHAQGYRDLIDVHYEKKMVKKLVNGVVQEVEKEWMYYEKSEYKWVTYGELDTTIHSIGRGLRSLGIQPGDTDRMLIFAATSQRWMDMYLGAQTQAIPIVTAYDSLGIKGLTHSIQQTECVAIFTDNDLLAKLEEPLTTCKSVKYIIHGEPIDPADKRGDGRIYKSSKDAFDKLLKARPDLKIISFDELLTLGDANKDIEPYPPKPEDLTCIMYTSGSTGPPKGVVLTHRNVVAGVGGISCNVGHDVVSNKDKVIAFLPLAHIFELAFELIGFFWGAPICYAGVKTLMDNSCRNCKGDMRELQPTIMVGVAAVWEAVKKGIMAQIEAQPAWKQKLFWGAYNSKVAAEKYSIPGVGTLVDKVVFKPIKAATGGNIRLLLNGGSPISGATQRFITYTIAPMLIGYGLTETVANTCITDAHHFEFGVAGSLVGSVTVKLIDVAEAGYYAKNNQGEILIHGGPVMSEYYKDDKETKEAFKYEAGWFSTGDIGQWEPNGSLKLIDRRKNLVKTQNGEYIALEKLESIYRSNPLVLNICCYADESKVLPVGIIIPVEPTFKHFVVKMGLAKNPADVTVADYCTNKDVCAAVTKSLNATGKKAGLTKIEMLQGVVILDGEWTPENGFVTSAQKLQRKKILDSCKEYVDELYAET